MLHIQRTVMREPPNRRRAMWSSDANDFEPGSLHRERRFSQDNDSASVVSARSGMSTRSGRSSATQRAMKRASRASKESATSSQDGGRRSRLTSRDGSQSGDAPVEVEAEARGEGSEVDVGAAARKASGALTSSLASEAAARITAATEVAARLEGSNRAASNSGSPKRSPISSPKLLHKNGVGQMQPSPSQKPSTPPMPKLRETPKPGQPVPAPGSPAARRASHDGRSSPLAPAAMKPSPPGSARPSRPNSARERRGGGGATEAGSDAAVTGRSTPPNAIAEEAQKPSPPPAIPSSLKRSKQLIPPGSPSGGSPSGGSPKQGASPTLPAKTALRSGKRPVSAKAADDDHILAGAVATSAQFTDPGTTSGGPVPLVPPMPSGGDWWLSAVTPQPLTGDEEHPAPSHGGDFEAPVAWLSTSSQGNALPAFGELFPMS